MSELFYPEETSTGYFLTEIARGMSSTMDVKVICGKPTYSEHGMAAPRKERWNGMDIYRLPATSFKKDRLFLRAINMFTLTVSAIFYLFVNWKKNDRLLLVTNPPSLIPIVALIGKIKGARPYLLVHDVYPDILAATGFLKKEAFVYRCMDYVMTRSFRTFEKVVVLGRDMQYLIAAKTRIPESEIPIIPNWADCSEILPVPDGSNAFAAGHGLADHTIIQFSGNIGRTHDIESVLQAAKALKEMSNIKFLFAGYGGKAAWLAREIDRSELGNIKFIARQPRESLGPMLSSSRAIVISFNDQMLGLSVPSRMYNVLSAATPIIAMADPGSELALMVSENNAGWVIAPHDAAALTELILWLSTPEGKADAAERGAAGRRAVCTDYTLQQVLDKYSTLFSIDTDGKR